MDNTEKIEKMLIAAQIIKESIEKYNKCLGDSSCDKHGAGFNRDDRFSAIKMTLSIDSWRGYYGNSGCSTAIHVGDEMLFKEAFLIVLNRQFEKLLLATAQELERGATQLRDEALRELKEKTERIEKLTPENMEPEYTNGFAGN